MINLILEANKCRALLQFQFETFLTTCSIQDIFSDGNHQLIIYETVVNPTGFRCSARQRGYSGSVCHMCSLYLQSYVSFVKFFKFIFITHTREQCARNNS